MQSFTRVLACTDFSEPANRAVAAGFGLLSQGGGTVVLCHVLDEPPVANPMYAHYYRTSELDPEHRQAAEAEARKGLGELIPDGASEAGIQVELKIGHGQAVDELLRLSEELQVDVVVVGTRGLTGLTALLLGSVVDRIVRMATCPVLVVR